MVSSPNDDMKVFADNLWQYFQPMLQERLEHNIGWFRAVVTENPGDGKLTVQRPFDDPFTIKCISSMSGASVGDNVLIFSFGENLGTNAIVVGTADGTNIGGWGEVPLSVANGGTGKTTNTSNSVLVGNGTSAVKNIASASGALYATSANGAPSFGTLPIAQGGTGATTANSAHWNLQRACYMLDNTADFSSYPWHKVASIEITTTTADRTITFLVTGEYASNSGGADRKSGILVCHIRTGSSKTFSQGHLQWLARSSAISLSDFVVRYTNVASTSCTAELWVQQAERYVKYTFTVLQENDRSANANKVLWTLYNTSGHGSSSYTTGSGGFVSTDFTMVDMVYGNGSQTFNITAYVNSSYEKNFTYDTLGIPSGGKIVIATLEQTHTGTGVDDVYHSVFHGMSWNDTDRTLYTRFYSTRSSQATVQYRLDYIYTK